MEDQLYDEFEHFIDMENTKDKYTTKTNSSVIIINSKDRNYNVDTTYDFSINLNSNSNFLNINKTFKNIVSIEFLYLIIPNIYVDIIEGLSLFNSLILKYNDNPINLMRIGDLPYLILNISEIKNMNTYGSNNVINKASFILKLDDKNDRTYANGGNTSVAGTTFTSNGDLNKGIVATPEKKMLYFKEISCMPILFNSTHNSYLNNLDFSITTPDGQLLYNLNNYLECDTINRSASVPQRIIITFKKYLCGDEYNIGDKLIFKDVEFATNNSDLKNFLMKDEGHTIIELTNSTGVGTGTTKLYNQITIPYKYSIDLDTTTNITGDSVINNNLNLNAGTEVSFSGGKAFNLSLQLTMGFKINSEERDEIKLHSHII